MWKTALPPGHSSPVLTESRIFLTAHTADKTNYQLLVIALDRATGKELWRREVPRSKKGRIENVNGPASPSPVTDGESVYAFFQEFGLISFTADGKERWRLPLGPFNIYYGFGASPMLVDDLLVLPVDQDLGAYLLAIDRRTGKQRWRVERPHVISGYSTPTVYRPAGGPAQVVIPESFQLTSYAVADGRKLWWVRGLACEMKSVASLDGQTLYVNGWGFPQNQPGRQVATVSFDEGLKRYDTNSDGPSRSRRSPATSRWTRCSPATTASPPSISIATTSSTRASGRSLRSMLASENGLLAVTLGGQGDMTASAIKWRYQRPVPQVPSTLLYKGVLFMVNDSGILISFDPATGAVLKQGRLKGAIDKYFASPVGADGRVWLVSQDGTMSVVSAKAEWEIVAVNALDDEVFATPAIADGRMYVRTRGHLYCVREAVVPGRGQGSPGRRRRVQPEAT